MLMMAAVLAAGWLRSLFVTDLILIPTANELHMWISDRQGIAWVVETQTDEQHQELMYDISVPFVVSPHFFRWNGTEWNLKFSFAGFNYFNGPVIETFTGTQFEQAKAANRIPHLFIILPLTLLSACLLLTRPRPTDGRTHAQNNTDH